METGTRLGPYEILEPLGAGGMGEVYLARDTRLGRLAALKVVGDAMSADHSARTSLLREARTASKLNHPHICTIYDVGEDDGQAYIGMEYVEGRVLSDVIAQEEVPIDVVVRYGTQMADALAYAHENGIVHRDLKSLNVMVTRDGRVKILDFGLAQQVSADELEETMTAFATVGPADAIVGTLPYMAPEQFRGQPADRRSDVFSLGVVLFEVIARRRPFTGDSAPQLIASILKDEPVFVAEDEGAVPTELWELVRRCLEKDPTLRPQSGGEVRDALRSLRPEPLEGSPGFRRPAAMAGLALLGVVLVAAGWQLVQRNRELSFTTEALPRLEQLATDRKYAEAFDLARSVERIAGPEAVSDTMWDRITRTVSITTEPSGAQLTAQAIESDHEPWAFGVSPLTDVRVPRGLMHWRVAQDGFAPADRMSGFALEPFVLLATDDGEEDMVRVPAADGGFWLLSGIKAQREVPLGPYLIDRYEVSNSDYAAFVEAGGYEREEYWRHAFHDGDATISFTEAMERFRDAIGRPGPAGWRLGDYPDGAGELPVTGVSWYEAAAYAEFVGKELPTIYHWYYAENAGDIQELPGFLLPLANFSGDAPRPRSEAGVMSAHGAYEMAGNVREWSATSVGADRLTLGGAWSEPSYVYLNPEVRSPLNRSERTGFRCIRRLGEEGLSSLATAPVERVVGRDYRVAEPVGDEVYAGLERYFERAPVALEPRVERTPEPAKHWTKQRVSYAAGYGNERMLAWLYLPRNAAPPYQTMILMGGQSTFYQRSSETEADFGVFTYAEEYLRGGRAVLFPLWKGAYERSDGFHPGTASMEAVREQAVMWVSELRRSVDYLQSRDDIDAERIGYQGASYGAIWGPVFMALEPRLRIAVLVLGGYPVVTSMPPEIDLVNYVPRITAPILMMNGLYDAIFPYETAQLPMFQAIGTRDQDKRHVTFPSGHSSASWTDHRIRESFAWLDRYFGEPRPIR